MGVWKAILAIFLVGLFVFLVMPSGTFGTPTYTVEISAQISQQKVYSWLTLGLIPAWTISDVNVDVKGQSANWEHIPQLWSIIAEIPTVRFCVDDRCQKNREIFIISLESQETTSESIPFVPAGTHSVTIELIFDGKVETSYAGRVEV